MPLRTGPIPIKQLPRGAKEIPGSYTLTYGATRATVEQFLQSGFYQEPKRLLEWFDPTELDRLKELSWADDEAMATYRYKSIFLRPFAYDGQMVSAPAQLVLRLGRANFSSLYESTNLLDRLRIHGAFADDEIAENATDDDQIYSNRKLGSQLGYLKTLHLFSEIESHLTKLCLGVVEFTAMQNPKRPPSNGIWDRLFKSAWKMQVTHAIRHSDVVFIIPSFHGGTLWEVEQLVASADTLKRAAFVIPTIMNHDLSYVADYWKRTFDELAKRFNVTTDDIPAFNTLHELNDKQFLLSLEGTVLSIDSNKSAHLQSPLHFYRPVEKSEPNPVTSGQSPAF